MIKDFFVSFGDNFKEKTKNPLLGIYVTVWLFRNWELVYTLFNFDSEQKLKDKISFINSYYKKHDFLENLLTNIYWSFGLLVVTYILINISRLIVNFSEKKISPWIYKISDSKSIVLKSSFDRILSERDDLQTRLDSERESKSRLETRIKNLELEIIDITTPKQDTKKNSPDPEIRPNGFDDLAKKVYEKLKTQDLVDKYNSVVVGINKGRTFSNYDHEITDFMIELGLIKFEKLNYNETESYYQITTLGEAVLNLIRLE